MIKTLKTIGVVVLYLAWTIAWYFITDMAFNHYSKDEFLEATIGPNQTVKWYSTADLILPAETKINVRSNGSNFTVTDKDDNFICTGIPVPMLPHEAEQPFECLIETSSETTLNIDHTSTIYTTTQDPITFLVEDISISVAGVFAVSIPATIFVMSVLFGIFSLGEFIKGGSNA